MRIIFRCDPALAGQLAQPVAARSSLPDWLRQMPANAFSPAHNADIRTVKQCPPFVDAMTHGFVFTLPCDIAVQQGVFSWDWPLPTPDSHLHPRAPLSFHAPAQVEGTPFHDPDQIIVKFNSFWTVELPTGWSLFAMHPANRFDLPFQMLSGLVDADRYNEVGILFPAVWTNPEFSGLLPRGTPLAQCFPVRRESLDLEFDTFSEQQVAAYDRVGQTLLDSRGVYRKQYRDQRSGKRSEFASERAGVKPEPPSGR
ncbi:MAG: hypothetical protein PF501_16170 [Salinisphaera sp.]|jgi:hypothetical protein|nr:hypothetical protein [Salinisphaera sp.]